MYLDAALDAAPAEAVRKQAPLPNPQPAPGTPFAHYLFRDREADVIREMVTFYERLKK